MRDGDGENFVRDAKGAQKPIEEGKFLVEFLRERQAHQKVSGVDDKLREDKSTLTTQLNLEHQNQYTAGIVAQAVGPVNAALAALQSDVDGIKCKLPRTETIVAQPNYIPVNAGINVGLAPYSLCASGLGFAGFGGLGFNNNNGFY